LKEIWIFGVFLEECPLDVNFRKLLHDFDSSRSDNSHPNCLSEKYRTFGPFMPKNCEKYQKHQSSLHFDPNLDHSDFIDVPGVGRL
jgi:hypothetical protein